MSISAHARSSEPPQVRLDRLIMPAVGTLTRTTASPRAEAPAPMAEGADQLVDEPVSVVVRGCPATREVRVVATSVDPHGVAHTSWADYSTTSDGTVTPAVQAPVAGTYRGTDPYGLWWSMTSDDGTPFPASTEPVPTRMVVECEGHLLGTAAYSRLRCASAVTIHDVGAEGLTGRLYLAPGRSPGVVVLGGSEGGHAQADQVAAMLASRGLSALALAYFGAQNLPGHLTAVPLEYVAGAAAFLARHPRVTGPGVGLLGSSRGAELALLVAAHCGESVRAVVAFSPSSFVWSGVATGREPVPAWTHGGRPVPWATPRPTAPGQSDAGGREAYLRALNDASAARASIPVEQVQGAMLFVTGDDDQLWPSDVFAELAMQRLHARGHPYPDRHLRFPGAGHLAARPPGLPAIRTEIRHPADGRIHSLGGSRAANARASASSWPISLEFLRTALAAR